MDWMSRLNDAMDYLEDHLTEEVDYDRLAQIACCSTYHFQRMFGYLAGATLSEYVRRRRMSLAAADLQSSMWRPNMAMLLPPPLTGRFKASTELRPPWRKNLALL